MTFPYEIGAKSSGELFYILLLGVPDIIYPTIKEMASFKALTYYSCLKKLQTLYLFYKTTPSREMLYMVHTRLCSYAKMVLILLDCGLRPNFSPFLITHLETIHLVVRIYAPYTFPYQIRILSFLFRFFIFYKFLPLQIISCYV